MSVNLAMLAAGNKIREGKPANGKEIITWRAHTHSLLDELKRRECMLLGIEREFKGLDTRRRARTLIFARDPIG